MYSTELPSILCSTGNKSLQAEMKKEKVHRKNLNQSRNRKPRNFWLSDMQVLFEKPEFLPPWHCCYNWSHFLFNVLAKKELHKALVAPWDFHRGKHPWEASWPRSQTTGLLSPTQQVKLCQEFCHGNFSGKLEWRQEEGERGESAKIFHQLP